MIPTQFMTLVLSNASAIILDDVGRTKKDMAAARKWHGRWVIAATWWTQRPKR